jgi:hypothetical protein
MDIWKSSFQTKCLNWMHQFLFLDDKWRTLLFGPFISKNIQNEFRKFFGKINMNCKHYYNSWFFKGPSWLTSLFLLTDMYILTIGLGLEWHVYFWLVTNLTKVTYLTIHKIKHSQVEQKNDHLGQNDQWFLVNYDI